ncbi:hypothetical protein Peur_003369 [Populus x canadensis]
MKQQQLQTRDYLQRRALPQVQSVRDNRIAKKRWCLSSCYSARFHAIGVFSQADVATWHCDLSWAKSGGGFGKQISTTCFSILSWEFCSRDLEELCCLEVQFYLRFELTEQIVDIFKYCMKDLRTFSWDNKIEPIESLKKYSQNFSTTKLQKDQSQENDQLGVPQCFPTEPNKLSTSHFPSGNSNDNSIMSKGGLLNSSDMVRHCIFPKSCISSNVGKLEQPSLLYERCERSASSTPSQVPKTLSIHAACQEQDAATDGMTFDHKTLVAVASGMHQVVLWKIPGAGFMVASNADSQTW